MAKNYMQDVAKMLGVELEEEFEIEETLTKSFYKFTVSGLWSKCSCNNWGLCENYALIALITGEYHIKKLPWQPKIGDRYWSPSADFTHSWCSEWKNTSIDFAFKVADMIFRTKEECEAALPELRKKYLGGESK